jgi:hypothetical protein
MAFVPWDIFSTTRYENAFPLALVLGFDYQGHSLTSLSTLLYEIAEVEKLIGSYPGLWEEFKLFCERLLH